MEIFIEQYIFLLHFLFFFSNKIQEVREKNSNFIHKLNCLTQIKQGYVYIFICSILSSFFFIGKFENDIFKEREWEREIEGANNKKIGNFGKLEKNLNLSESLYNEMLHLLNSASLRH